MDVMWGRKEVRDVKGRSVNKLTCAAPGIVYCYPWDSGYILKALEPIKIINIKVVLDEQAQL